MAGGVANGINFSTLGSYGREGGAFYWTLSFTGVNQTLYRAASAHLKSGPRAYAETVGAERRPILLGDILVGREYAVLRPPVDLNPFSVSRLQPRR